MLTIFVFPLLDIFAFRPLIRQLKLRRMTEKALVESKKHTENILRSMTDALFVVAPDATIQTVNTTVSTLTGYTEQEFQGILRG